MVLCAQGAIPHPLPIGDGGLCTDMLPNQLLPHLGIFKIRNSVDVKLFLHPSSSNIPHSKSTFNYYSRRTYCSSPVSDFLHRGLGSEFRYELQLANPLRYASSAFADLPWHSHSKVREEAAQFAANLPSYTRRPNSYSDTRGAR